MRLRQACNTQEQCSIVILNFRDEASHFRQLQKGRLSEHQLSRGRSEYRHQNHHHCLLNK